MSVTVVEGDLFDYPCWVKVITVNTKGAMGAGIAYAYRERFWDAYLRYRKRCLAGQFKVNDLLVQKAGGQWWVLFPTKDDWQQGSELPWIEENLKRLKLLCEQYKVVKVAMPWLGCRNGGLTREQVYPLIEATFGASEIECVVVSR